MNNQYNKKHSILIAAIILFSLLGIADSIYLGIAHYIPSTVDFCSGLKGGFECDVVNTSEYSTIDGVINFILGTELYIPVPFALLSIFLFAFIIITAVFIYKKLSISIFRLNITYIHLTLLCKILLIVSLFFGLFLIYTQAKLIMAWCLLCIILDTLILSVNIAFWLLKYYPGKSH